MPAKITINIDKTAGKSRILEACDQALTDLRDPIIDDINRHVPISGGISQDGGGGDLRESAKLHSDQEAQAGKLTIRWDTPYAQYQHGGLVMHGSPKNRTYGPDELHYTNSMARKEWDNYAKQQYGDEWGAQIDKRMTRYL
ncbi:MAG: minor capsid protein [Fusicatenibacter sp.]|nr:minor capsid protein [Fusicatenibacter sp.]